MQRAAAAHAPPPTPRSSARRGARPIRSHSPLAGEEPAPGRRPGGVGRRPTDEGSRRQARSLHESGGLLAYAVEVAAIREAPRQARLAARPVIRPALPAPSLARGEGARPDVSGAGLTGAPSAESAVDLTEASSCRSFAAVNGARYARRLRRSKTIDSRKTSEVSCCHEVGGAVCGGEGRADSGREAWETGIETGRFR